MSSPIGKIAHILYLHEFLNVKQYFNGMKVWLDRIKERFLPPVVGG
jgi:hypothetical protein